MNLKEKRTRIAKSKPRSSKIIKGSLVKIKRTCGKANCQCTKGKKHVSLYLSQSKQGKTRMTYIPKRQEKKVMEYVNRYKELIKVLDELSELNIQIIKQERVKNS